MPALVAGIHVLVGGKEAWMAGTSPAMTMWKRSDYSTVRTMLDVGR